MAVLVAIAGALVYLGYFTAPTVEEVCHEPPESEWDGIDRVEKPAEIEVEHSLLWIDAEVTLEVVGTDVDHTWHHGLVPETESDVEAPEGVVGREYVLTITDNGRTVRETGTIRSCED